MTALAALTEVEVAASGRRILGPLSLEVSAGEALAVVGPNGAGKTTLLRALAGLAELGAGELQWRGTTYRALGRRRLARRIAYVPQVRPARVPLTVAELVLLGRYPYLGRWQVAPAAADHRAVAQALALAGLEPLAGRRVDRLSGGERQAAYIAAAIAQQAELMVLDEPTAHLDPSHQRSTAQLVGRWRAVEGRTVVFATHDLAFAARVGSRVVALSGGRILAAGGVAEVLEPRTLERLFAAPFAVAGRHQRSLPLLDYGA